VAIRAVCWDWNGTLLDDVDRCVRAMNRVLATRGLEGIRDVAGYRATFRFPLSDFYAGVGIGAAQYRASAELYLAVLESDAGTAALHEGARETIRALRAREVRQVLASATVADLLETQLRPYAVRDEFEEVLSIVDPYAASKRDVIAGWLRRSGLAPAEVLMVGDTNHDREIAGELGTRFVYFSGGHQDLTDDGSPRIDRLSQLLEVL
jgi:phosphoglycolate phosphatase